MAVAILAVEVVMEVEWLLALVLQSRYIMHPRQARFDAKSDRLVWSDGEVWV